MNAFKFSLCRNKGLDNSISFTGAGGGKGTPPGAGGPPSPTGGGGNPPGGGGIPLGA